MYEDTAVEKVILALEDQISGGAASSMDALARLEGQIVREQAALGRLETELARASAKLQAMAEGAPDDRVVAAFEKQKLAVVDLEKKLSDVNDTLAIMSQAHVRDEDLRKVRAEAERLSDKLDVARLKQAELAEKMSAKSVNVETYRKQADTVAKLGDAAANQRDKIAGMGERMSRAEGKAKSFKERLELMGKTLKANGADLGIVDSQATKLIASLSKMGPEVAAVAAGILILTAVVSGFIGIVAKGIVSSGEMRDEFLRLKGEVKSLWMTWNGFFRGATVSATQLQAAINGVDQKTNGLSRDKIEGYALQLARARIPAKDLQNALNTMVIAGTGGTDKMAQRFLSLATTYRMFGKSVTGLAEVFKKQFGQVAAEKTLALGIQLTKLRENITFLFSGADVEPFLRGLQSILGIFDRNTSSAKGMRDIITALVEKGINLFLRLAIVLVKTYLWIREHETAWKALKVIVGGIGLAMAALVGVVLVAVGVIGLAMAAISAPVVGFLALVGMAVKNLSERWDAISRSTSEMAKTVGGWFSLVGEWVSAALNKLRNIDLSDIGKKMIEGLVKGISDSITAVEDAVKKTGEAALKKFKDVLGIHSPALAARIEVGRPIGQGVAMGISDTRAMVDRATRSLSLQAVANDNSTPALPTAAAQGAAPVASASLPSNPAPPPSAAASLPSNPAESQAGPTFVFHGCTFGGQLTEDDVRTMMAHVFEQARRAAPTRAA